MFKITVIIILLFITSPARSEIVDIERLATAIYYAEGGRSPRDGKPRANVKYPYGVLSVKCHGDQECRAVCVRSIKHRLARFKKDRGATGTAEAFIWYFSGIWASIGVSNDPHGLNKNWYKNTLYWYKKLGG